MQKRLSFRHTLYASYAGYFVQAIINNFLPLIFLTLQRDFDISYRKISLLIFVNFIIQLLIDLASTLFVDRIGYRKSIVGAHFLAFIGLTLLSILPYAMKDAYLGIILSVLVYGVGSGLIEVIISPLVEACPTENKAGSMSLLHSFYCWGQMLVVLLSTVYFSVFGTESWPVLVRLWALVPLGNAFYLLAVPMPDKLKEFKGTSLRELFSMRIFILTALMMFCSGASEIGLTQWSSAFAESALGVSKTVGDLLGPCLFAALMGTARVLYSRLSEKISLGAVMSASAALCTVSYLVAALSPYAMLSLAACAVCGFSVGVMWPGTFSLAAKRIPSGGTTMFALLALFGDLGCATGPGAVGVIAGLFSDNLHIGILAATVFPIALLLISRAKKLRD